MQFFGLVLVFLLRLLDLFPGAYDILGDFSISEHVRMSGHHFIGNGTAYILHIEQAFLFCDLCLYDNLKEQVADFPPQPVITKDNVTMQIDTVVYFQITDPKLYTYGIEQPMVAIENLAATTLRNIIGDLELDQCLTSRDIINTQMRSILDEATDPWGIKVNRVELKNILPPKEIQNAMEKQMKAERERREAILKAEGEKRAAILEAEGEKESAILRADAKKQQQILEAEGEAEAILKVQTATAEGIRLINEAAPSEAVLKIKALEAFANAANGSATKIIIPSEIQGLAGLAAGVIESVQEN